MASKIKRLAVDNNIFIILIIVSVWATFAVKYFTKEQNILNIFVNTSLYGTLAIGMTFILLTGAFDLSLGMQVALSTIITTLISSSYGFAAGAIVSILICACIGLMNGFVVTKLEINPMIATLATMTVLKGVGLFITGDEAIKGTDTLLPQLFTYKVFGIIQLPILAFLVFLLIGAFILRNTKFGTNIYVVGGNEEAGKMAGINVDRIRALAFMIGGICAALAGIMLASRVNTGSVTLVDNVDLTTISACVIGGIKITGGKGRMINTLFGVLVIQTINDIMTLKALYGSLQLLITGVVLVIVLVADRFTQTKQTLE